MRHWAFAILLAVLLPGCFYEYPARQCDDATDCLKDGVPGVCLASPSSGASWCAFPDGACPSGHRYGPLTGDGLSNVCVAIVVDSGLGDAAPPDGSLADAAPPDGSQAACSPASVSDNAAAELVLGQADFFTTGANTNGRDDGMDHPSGVATVDGRLWVADATNGRILQWNAPPIVNQQAANYVLGQPNNFGTPLSGPTQSLMSPAPAGMRVFSVGDRVIASDIMNHRVLVWQPIPTTDGVPATLVLGQPDFTSNAPGKGAANLNLPQGIWSDGTSVAVADYGNSRVLIWNTFPTTNGAPADVVIGRPDFGIGAGDPIGPPTAASLGNGSPYDIWSDGTRLFVLDTATSRIMVWNQFPSDNGQAADYLIGQGTFEGSLVNAGSGAGPNEFGFDHPRGLTGDGCNLYVADTANHRVVIFTPIPAATGAAASIVLGQPNFGSGEAPTSANALSFDNPQAVAIEGDKLYVADTVWNRVVRFDIEATP